MVILCSPRATARALQVGVARMADKFADLDARCREALSGPRDIEGNPAPLPAVIENALVPMLASIRDLDSLSWHATKQKVWALRLHLRWMCWVQGDVPQ